MIKFLRKILMVPMPAVSKDEALAVAKRLCSENGWPWEEPVAIDEGLRRYYIRTNASKRGGNVNMQIDCLSGVVISAHFSQR